MIVTALLKGSVLPAVLTGALLWIAGFLPGGVAVFIRRLSFASGFLLAYYNINALPQWPPQGATEGLFYVALLSFLWPYLENLSRQAARSMKWLYFAGLSLLLLQNLFLKQMDHTEAAIHILLLLFFGQILWWLFSKGYETFSGMGYYLVSILVMSGLSIFMLLMGSGLLSQLAGTYCALHAAALVLSGLSPRFQSVRDSMWFSVSMMFCFSIMSYYFLEAPLISLGALLSPLLLMYAWRFLPFRPRKPIGEAFALLVIGLIPIAWVLYPAYKAYSSLGY